MGRAPESAYLKLARAKRHLGALNHEITIFEQSNPYSIDYEASHDRRQIAVKLRILREPPIEMGLLVGDCIYNLRCALDHLVYALPRQAGTDARWEKWSQFPIADDAARFAASSRRDLVGIDPGAVTAIESLQPYFAGNRPEGEPFWYLRELSNLDKHRLSPLVYSQAAQGNVECPKPPTGTAHGVFSTGDLEDGATILKLYFSDPAPPRMEMTLTLTFGITIRDVQPSGDPAAGVNFILEPVYDRVEHAIRTLEPFFP